MPAKSKAQRVAMAIALHHPEQLHERNKGLASMSKESLRDFVSTKDKGLPYRVGTDKKSKPRRKRKVYGE